jgi:hypothetical protein
MDEWKTFRPKTDMLEPMRAKTVIERVEPKQDASKADRNPRLLLFRMTALVRLKDSPIHKAYATYATEAQLPKRDKLRIDRLLPMTEDPTQPIQSNGSIRLQYVDINARIREDPVCILRNG